MSPKLRKLGILAGALVLAMGAGQAGVAEPVRGKSELLLTASFTGNAASLRPSRTLNGPMDLSPVPPDAFSPAEEGPDGQIPFSQYSVRLYPIESGEVSARMAAETAVRQLAPFPGAGKSEVQVGRPSEKKSSLPEPDSWAMIVVGLLGVGAIARRRMSA